MPTDSVTPLSTIPSRYEPHTANTVQYSRTSRNGLQTMRILVRTMLLQHGVISSPMILCLVMSFRTFPWLLTIRRVKLLTYLPHLATITTAQSVRALYRLVAASPLTAQRQRIYRLCRHRLTVILPVMASTIIIQR